MANKKAETSKGSFAERSWRYLRNLHIGIGSVALAGVVVFPQAALLSGIAGIEGANVLVHEELRQRAARSKSKDKSK